jgi:hypothetical protein
MKTVDMIASGYEWCCPDCPEMNHEIETKTEVKCHKCGKQFEIGEVYHAHGK